MQKEFFKQNRGITLISLVVTIVILIILATISINAVLGENGLIKRAEKATEHQANAEKRENDAIDELLYQVGVATGEIVGNPYDEDGWTYAWVSTNGVWDNTKYEAGANIPEGEGIVVAKLYETGNKITPPDLVIGEEMTCTFPKGNEYVMVIEGQGDMGALVEVDSEENETYNAWMLETVLFLEEESETCTMPYVNEVIICNGVTNIGRAAFFWGTGLEKITINNEVTSIGDMAFVGCTSLIDITIPESVTSMGDEAFSECTSLTNVTINSMVAIDIKTIFADSNITNLTIGGGVTAIEDATFMENTSLENVTIGNSVTSIGGSAFGGCTNLTSITIPDSVRTIGGGAFYDCINLTNVTIPDSVTTIEDNVFYGCTNLTNVTMGNRVSSIGKQAFIITNLKSITIPNSVTQIGAMAFYDCTSLTTVIIDSVAIASTITERNSNGRLAYYATTIYINEEIEEVNIGSYITTNYTKQTTSDKTGYVKYVKNKN